MRKIWISLAALVAAGAAAGMAQAAGSSPTIEARIDAWSSYSVAGPTCEALGYDVHPERFDQIGGVMAAEGQKVGMAEDRMYDLMQAGNARHVAALKSGVAALADARSKAIDDPALGPALKTQLASFTAGYSDRCAAAAADPVFKLIVVAPPTAALATAKQTYMDNFLAPAGLASFQPPEALARGDLVMATGMCKAFLSDADMKLYQGGVLDGPAPADPALAKLRQWYAGQYQAGVGSAGELDKDQCARAIPRLKAKLPK